MKVTEAVLARRSTRQFLPTPVADETIRSLLEQACRAPSRNNFQPWKIFVVNGASLDALKAEADATEEEPPGYEILPQGIAKPHRMARQRLSNQLFDTLGITDEDLEVQNERLNEVNHRFFDAPAALFCFVDEQLGKAQWTDLGIFLQTFMLLAQEAGIDTCAQEYWAQRSNLVSTFVDAPEELMLVCGMAIGHRDPDAPINSVATDRLPFDDWATFV